MADEAKPSLLPEDLTAVPEKDLDKLESRIWADYDKAKKAPKPDLATMRGLIEAGEQIVSERDRRAEEATKAEQELAELDARREAIAGKGDEEESTDETTTPTGESKPETPAEAPATPAATTPSAVPAAIAASAAKPAAKPAVPPATATKPKGDQRPPEARKPLVTITAAGDLYGHSAGDQITIEDVGRAFSRKAEALMGQGGKGSSRGPVPIASFATRYPEERMLTAAAGAQSNLERIMGVIGPEALEAAGGLCAPVEADYSLMTIATAARPVRDALARFGADRGGIRFITPPTLTDVAAGVFEWTEANDTNPTDPTTKPCVTITCGVETEVLIDAIGLCLTVGNFSRRTFPEQFSAWYELGLAQHARVAESKLLTRIAALSTQATDVVQLGVARDGLEALNRAATAYRNRNRMARDAELQTLLPEWFGRAMQADITRQQPGDDTWGRSLSVIEGYIGALDLSVAWYKDTPTTGASMQFPAQADGGTLNRWPATARAFIHSPGSFLFLDGGMLDLGVEIRDSTLNSTNDVQAFLETFEQVAFVGVESLELAMDVCVTGESAGNVDVLCSGS